MPCQFKDKRYGYECDTPEPDVLKSGWCIFHDNEYLNDPDKRQSNEQNIIRKLSDKIENSISDNKPLTCIKYRLPSFIFYKNFTIPVNFSEAIFMGSVDFSGAQFTEEANFSGAQFTEKAIFYNAQFTKEAYFNGAQFTEEANFSGAQFTKEAYFNKAQFTEEANFSYAQFTEKAIFYNAQFTKEAYFNYVQFTKEAYFNEAQFTEEANFAYAQFTEKADFSGAQFTERANFNKAQFTEEADFSYAQFTKEAYFNKAQFTEEADFSYAQFAEANFFEAQFHAESSFNEAEFMNETDFSHSKFIQEAKFVDTIFGFRSSFNYVLFRDPENVIFQTDDLSQVSLANTDISRIRFGENVKWGLANRPTRYLKIWGDVDKNKFKILEEREIETLVASNGTVQNIALGSVLAVYRSLRENYEYRLRYDEAGEFFIREMEMKRKYKEVSLKKNEESQEDATAVDHRKDEQVIVEIQRNNWIIPNLSLTSLYYHLSRYGESFSRPTLFGIGIVLFSTLLWLTQPNAASPDFSIHDATFPVMINSTDVGINSTNLGIAFKRSLTNFLPNLSFGTETGAGLLDFAFKIVGGAVTFGLIIIALRRKFERKFRH
jgi:uncharacterized protein YjbI with pentapeptide repeats